MKKRERVKLASKLLPSLPSFAADNDGLIFAVPIGSVLRAFLVANSDIPNNFYFHGFYMPMCTPTDHIALSYGNRLISPDRTNGWSTEWPDLDMALVAAIRKQALPELNSLQTIPTVIAAIRKRVGRDMVFNPHAQEEVGYLLILTGRYAEAAEPLRLLAKSEATATTEWQRVVARRGKLILEKLEKDPQLAIDQIRAWEDETFKNLKLEKWR